MSREDPQFKLRMPPGLRSQAEIAAKASGRSLNSELVTRLESSFLAESTSDELMPAVKARELAAIARAAIPEEIRRRCLQAVNKAVQLGHSSANVDLTDMRLDGNITDCEVEKITNAITAELNEAGYFVEWDGSAFIWIKF